MGRKVQLTRSEVEMANSMGIPLEKVAKAKLPKRGRPVGSKNKKPTPAQMHKAAQAIANSANPIDSFAKTLKEWDEMENQVNWEEVAKKQESKLAAYIAENDDLAKICIMRWEEIQHLKYLVSYLENRNADSSI
jgi:hypothetical protein